MKSLNQKYNYSPPPAITLREEVALILTKWNLEDLGVITSEKVSILYEENFGKKVTISEISQVLEELYWEDTVELFEQQDSDREISSYLM